MHDRPIGTTLEYTLRVRTPVYAGAGKRVEPLEFFHDGESLRRIDAERFRAGLSPELAKAFEKWASAQQAALQASRDGRAASDLRRGFHLGRFFQEHGVARSSVAAALANATRYRLTGRAPDREVIVGDCRPDGALHIAGAHLAAALRAGLAYAVLIEHGAELRDALWNGIEHSDVLGFKKILNELERALARIERGNLPPARLARSREKALHDAARACAHCIEQLVFFCGKRPEDRPDEITYSDPAFDVFARLEISDAVAEAASDAMMKLYPHANVAPLRETPEGRRGGVRVNRWTEIECIPEEATLHGTLRLDVSHLLEAVQTRFIWVDLDHRLRRIWGGYTYGLKTSQVELGFLQRAMNGLNRLAEAAMAADLAWEASLEATGVRIEGFRSGYLRLERAPLCLRLGRDCGLSMERFGELVVRRDATVLPALALAIGLIDPAASQLSPPPIDQDLPKTELGHVPPGWCTMEFSPPPGDVMVFVPPEVRPPEQRPAAPPARPERRTRPERPHRAERTERTDARPKPARPAPPPPPPPPPPKPAFKVGDKVIARVTAVDGGVFTLEVAGQTVTHRGILPWAVGDSVKVKIVKASADGAHVKQVIPA